MSIAFLELPDTRIQNNAGRASFQLIKCFSLTLRRHTGRRLSQHAVLERTVRKGMSDAPDLDPELHEIARILDCFRHEEKAKRIDAVLSRRDAQPALDS